ncbi:MAG: hypothetical protein FWE05_12860 [Defluviitaleaceae bacterium]|nr:hypothetical protein [Defluviitaleaceae bacterium]
MNSKIFTVAILFLTLSICVALIGFVYVAAFVVAGESILPSRRDNTVEPTRGIWVENIYESEYLNLRFEAPETWTVSTDVEIAMMIGIADEFLSDDSISDEAWAAAEYIIDMLAVNPLSGTSVQIAFERLPRGSRLEAVGYIELAAVVLELEEIRVNLGISETLNIGGYTWHQLGTEMDVADVVIHGRQLVNIEGGFARIITITYFGDPATIPNILDMFSPLVESPNGH